MRAKFVNETQDFERGKNPVRSMDVGIDPKMVKKLKKYSRRWPVTFDAVENGGTYYFGVLYDAIGMDYMIPTWTEKHLGEYLVDPNQLPPDDLDFEIEDGEDWFEIKPEFGPLLKRSVEFFNNKNEEVRFERGKDPKDALKIGHWGIKRALLNQDPVEADTMEGDAQRDWWEKGGIPEAFKDEIGFNESDPLSFIDFIGFDDDYYLENETPDWVDPDEFHSGFTLIGPQKKETNTNGWGTFIWQKGKLYDGTIVYHYIDGMGSGYITRKDWLKRDK